jgi:hypothetical protein
MAATLGGAPRVLPMFFEGMDFGFVAGWEEGIEDEAEWDRHQRVRDAWKWWSDTDCALHDREREG